jgi:hypothetical protein
MDRLDLAQQVLKTLKSSDEDHVLTMLATAWIHLSTVGITKSISFITSLYSRFRIFYFGIYDVKYWIGLNKGSRIFLYL